jgi:RimJ/RimL family protein N-acetyltransferase
MAFPDMAWMVRLGRQFTQWSALAPTSGREVAMIRGEKTRLRALEHDDLPHFVRWINDPEVRRFMTLRYPLSMTEEENWWTGFLERRDDYIFAIEVEDGSYIGNIGLHKVDRENRQAMLGIIIGNKAYWGQGYGADAIQAMLRWAFEYMNLNRVYLTVYAYNKRAIRCYEKCGIRHEGAMRQARYTGGQYHDELMMAILQDEFVEEGRKRN